MFVCLCNALREREIQRQVDAGASTVREVFESAGCEPRCCSCLPEIAEAIQRRRLTLAAGRSDVLGARDVHGARAVSAAMVVAAEPQHAATVAQARILEEVR